MPQVLNVLRLFEGTGDRQFLLFLLDVIPVVIPDRDVLTLLPGIFLASEKNSYAGCWIVFSADSMLLIV